MSVSPNETEASVTFFDDLPPEAVASLCETQLGLVGVRTVSALASWEAELASLPEDIRASLPQTTWRWVVYPWRHLAVRIPDEETYWAVVTSRNYPIITRREQSLLRRSTVLLIGLSTGRSVAQQLARLGVGAFVIADADRMAVSNFNRLLGAGLADLDLPKVVSVARELRELNPYLDVTECQAFLDEQSTSRILSEHPVDVVVEMIDNIDAKLAIRSAARERGLLVVMATDMDWDPYVDIERPDGALFNGRVTPEEIEQMIDPATDFRIKTALAMQFMGLERWADRSMLSGQLASRGLVRFWSQSAPAAATAGALATRVVFDILRGNTDLPARATVSLRDPMGTLDPIDESEELVVQLRSSVEQR